jgi:hypothetical protein
MAVICTLRNARPTVGQAVLRSSQDAGSTRKQIASPRTKAAPSAFPGDQRPVEQLHFPLIRLLEHFVPNPNHPTLVPSAWFRTRAAFYQVLATLPGIHLVKDVSGPLARTAVAWVIPGTLEALKPGRMQGVRACPKSGSTTRPSR